MSRPCRPKLGLGWGGSAKHLRRPCLAYGVHIIRGMYIYDIIIYIYTHMYKVYTQNLWCIYIIYTTYFIEHTVYNMWHIMCGIKIYIYIVSMVDTDI